VLPNTGMKLTWPGQLRSFAAHPRCSTDTTKGGNTMRRTVRLAAAVALAGPILLGSEARPEDQPNSKASVGVGSRVRIAAPAVVKGRVTGTVIAMDETWLLVSTDDTRLNLPRRAVTQLEVSLGRHRHTLKGMLIGAGVGAVALSALGQAACTSDCDQGRGSVFALGAGVGALIGAGILARAACRTSGAAPCRWRTYAWPWPRPPGVGHSSRCR